MDRIPASPNAPGYCRQVLAAGALFHAGSCSGSDVLDRILQPRCGATSEGGAVRTYRCWLCKRMGVAAAMRCRPARQSQNWLAQH